MLSHSFPNAVDVCECSGTLIVNTNEGSHIFTINRNDLDVTWKMETSRIF